MEKQKLNFLIMNKKILLVIFGLPLRTRGVFTYQGKKDKKTTKKKALIYPFKKGSYTLGFSVKIVCPY